MNLIKSRWPRIVECWCDEAIPSQDADVAILRQYTSLPSGVQSEESHTLLVSLAHPEENLFKAMNEATRRQVRRARDVDGVHTQAETDLTRSTIGEFCDFCSSIAGESNPPQRSPTDLLARHASRVLHLTRATLDGQIIVWHAYSAAGPRVRLLHSVSPFRSMPKERRNLLGRANRYLHWFDLQHFKASGFRTYDLGGWYAGHDDAAKLTINRFKEGFGGSLAREVNAVLPLSLVGRAFLKLRFLRGQALHSGARPVGCVEWRKCS